MEEEKRKGSIVAGEEVIINNEKNVIESLDTIEVNIIKEEKAPEVTEESIKVEDINNNDVEKADKKEGTKEPKNKKEKKKINKKVLIIILVGIVCVAITTIFIILQVNNINQKYKIDEPVDIFEVKNKIEDDDIKYVVGENDTLDFNDLNAEMYYLIDGVECPYDYEKYEEAIKSKKEIYTIAKISGLKDKNIENKINSEIIQKVKDFIKENNLDTSRISCRVAANFNDVLSVQIHSYDEQSKVIGIGYNVDLNTGNEIIFEDLFTKSAPIAAILSNSLGKALAWDFKIDVDYNVVGDEEYFKRREYLSNMNNRDTSEYEEMGLKLANWYNENKGNVVFSFTPFAINVYNVNIDGNRYYLTIPMYDNNYCIAIYKRFKSQNSIYEKDVSSSGYIPYSMPMSYYSNCKIEKDIEHGKVLKNLYIDMCMASYGNVKNEKIESMSRTLVQNRIQEEKNKAMNDYSKYYVLQGTAQLIDNTEFTDYYNSEIDGYFIPHYRMALNYSDIELENFDNLTKELSAVALLPTASADPYTLGQYYYSFKKNHDIAPFENKVYYFDIDGNYLGDDVMVVKDTSRDSYNPS